jgi:uncharacterized protein YhfF
LHLVLQKETANSSLNKAYLIKRLPKSETKASSLIRRYRKCKILTQNSNKPFNKITESFARKEGEGDLSLKHWKKVHKDFFSKRTKDFDEETLIVCEEFKIIKTN